MRIITFQYKNSGPRPGLIAGDRVVDLGAAGFATVVDYISAGAAGREAAERLSADSGDAAPLADVRLLAPILRPPKIICIGLNYRDHAREAKMEIPAVPTVFAKFATSIIAPGDPIVIPKSTAKPDYEAELAFVIGKGGRYIPAERWQEHVFGYMNLNDVSARDYQLATSQWTMGKAFDTFCPMGPWLVTADEIADPHELAIQTEINGELLQDSNTRELIFRIPQLVEFLSSVFTLEAGDVVSTGTPSGVGFGHKPPRWLRPGDDVIVRVEGLGELRNPVVAEAQ